MLQQPGRILLVVVLSLLACLTAEAGVDLVTVPGKEYVQLTIYNTADLTLARERRVLTFKKGPNRIQFSWANTLIDPTSLQFRVLEHEEKIFLQDTTYPPGRRDALQWNVISQVAGPVLVEISYFTSGLTWQAEYAGVSNYAETEMTFRGYVRVLNRSGEEYENARTRLMVGTVHLIERIADLARGQFRKFTREQRNAAIKHFLSAEAKYRRITQGGREVEYQEARGIAKEGLSEYFIFAIEGEETVRNQWSKRLQAVFAERVPIETYYRLSDVTTGGRVVKFYKFANRKYDDGDGKGALGTCPLPGGSVRVFGQHANGDLSYVGSQTVTYVPMGDRVLLNLGEDKDLVVQRELTDYRRTDIQLGPHGNVVHWKEHFYYQTRIHNTKGKPVRLEVERRIPRSHAVTDLKAIERFEVVDQHVQKYYVDLKPHEERVVRYHVVATH
ncbi:DUF4139 domain-containing protein [Planctomycetota bacterium]